jgi:hypothetical protein
MSDKMLYKTEIIDYWTKIAKQTLEGKKIVEVRYLNDEEMKNMNWYFRPVVFILDDGTFIVATRDDEGNDGGVLFYQKDGKDGVLPVISNF